MAAIALPGYAPPARRKRMSRRFLAALALSVLAHLAFFASPLHVREREPDFRMPGPMVVELEAPRVQVPAGPLEPAPAPAPQPVVRPHPHPVHVAPVVRAAPPAVHAEQPVVPPPVATPRPAPQVDMLAMINARRERRRERQAQEEAAESAAERQRGAGGVDAGLAALNRNLQTLAGDDGTGGIFQILSKGTLSAEFAFNGWQPGIHRHWREVIDVRIGPDGDLDRAIVRRMIQLIRGHYPGDFQWESRRLGRLVTLSARPEDQEGLEDFLLREFFDTPTVKPSRQ